jgi:hypothetical protein
MAVTPIPALKIGYFNPKSTIRALARGVGMAAARCAVAVRAPTPRPVVTAATCPKNSRRSDDIGALRVAEQLNVIGRFG